MSNLTRLFVNDIEVFVPPNTTVLEAAEKVGVQVRLGSSWGRGGREREGRGLGLLVCACAIVSRVKEK